MKKYLTSLLTAISCCLVSLPCAAESLNASVADQHHLQYKRMDINIQLNEQWNDPYNQSDIRVDVDLVSPSHKKLTLPAFYVTGESQKKSHWQARFTPQETGQYTYSINLISKAKQKRTTTAQFAVNESKYKGFLHPHNHWTLRFDNGDLFRGIGKNIGWEKRDNDDSKYFKDLHENKRFNYDDMLKKLSSNEGNFIRTWMIYWNLPVDWRWVDNASRYSPSTSRFNETGIARMDDLIAIAEKNNIYIMLALESHVGFMGSGWENSIYNKKNGGFAATPAEFFTSADAKAQYKNKLRFMVARWGYSPHIGIWEFFNEIDNVMYHNKDSRIPDEAVTQWHIEMSEYLASIDIYDRPITTSISHRDVQGLNDIKHIDINQKHIYKALDAIPVAINEYTNKHNKPYIIGEAGYEWDWSKNFDDFSAEMISDYKRQLWYGLFNPTPVLPLSWWWEYFDEKGMAPYFQRVNEINKLMLSAGNGKFAAIPLSVSDKNITAFALVAGDKPFIYLFNRAEKPVSARIQFEKPLTKIDYNAKAYSPETGKYSKFGNIQIEQGTDIRLGASEDKVLILE